MTITIAVFLAAASRPIDAAPQRSVPIHVIGVGSGPIDLITGGYETTGVFLSTLGPGKVTIETDGSTPFSATFALRTGAELYVTNDPDNPGPALPTHCPTTIGVASGPYAGAEFITGGTGRYENASGYITYTGCYAITENPRSSTGFTFTFTFNDHGTLNL